EFDLPRVFMSRKARLDERLHVHAERLVDLAPLSRNDKGLHYPAANLVGNADHSHHGHRRVSHQAIFDLGRADAIASGNDDVVIASVKPEIALLVAMTDVTGQKPPIAEFLRR